MAAEKTKRKNRRAADKEAELASKADGDTGASPSRAVKKAGKGAGGDGELMLRTKDEPRRERRYEPKAPPLAVLSVVAMSIGAVLIGAGTYAQWFRAESLGPLKEAPFLLAGGSALLIAVALFGQQLAKPIRVGDAGVALEKDPTELDRIEWRDVTRLILTSDALTVQGVGASISVPLRVHPQAAARIVAEASARLPKRVEDLDGTPPLAAPDDTQGEVLTLDPPQVAGAHCKSSEKVIAFEKDARLCGRCGEVYHKDSVPKRCLTCDARLKG
jgi:hypothetical protein